jgi:transcription antitermination factor NusG
LAVRKRPCSYAGRLDTIIGIVPNSYDIDWRGLEQVGNDWVRYGPELEENNRHEADLPEPRWYIVQTTPVLEDNVKILHSKINNGPWLQKTILAVLVPTTKVSKVKRQIPSGFGTTYIKMACGVCRPFRHVRRVCWAAGSQWKARVPAGEAHARICLYQLAHGQGAHPRFPNSHQASPRCIRACRTEFSEAASRILTTMQPDAQARPTASPDVAPACALASGRVVHHQEHQPRPGSR